MNEVATLIQAIAALLWPLFAFTVLIIFHTQIGDLIKRFKKGKLFGQEFELEETLLKLDSSASSVEQEVAVLSKTQIFPQSEAEAVTEEITIKSIISEASDSPKTALILLAIELEKLARQILASTGYTTDKSFFTIKQTIAELDNKFGLPRHVQSSLNLFWETRNRIIHGGLGSDEDILRAIDSGLTIYKALNAIPREIHIVEDCEVPIFSNSELTERISGIKGVMLKSRAVDGTSKPYFRMFPTTKTHFKKGEQVSWEWNLQKSIGNAWYKDAITQQPKLAWSGSTEFIGRPINDL